MIEIAGGDLDPDVAAISNELLPDSSRIDHLYNPSLSAGNVAAFRVTLKSTPEGGLDDEGIYRGDGTILVEVAREGQTVPEGGGQFASFGHTVAINLNAQVLFLATLWNTPFGSADNKALYLWDEVHGMTKLVRKGDTIPSSGGVVLDILALLDLDFGGFRSLNDAGEAVAILNMDGIQAKDGVYLFRSSDLSGVAAQAAPARPRLVAAPNPWVSGALTVRFSPQEGTTSPPGPRPMIEVFNASGRFVRRLSAATSPAVWDGIDEGGRAVGPGLYFIRMGAGAVVQPVRVVRLAR